MDGKLAELFSKILLLVFAGKGFDPSMDGKLAELLGLIPEVVAREVLWGFTGFIFILIPMAALGGRGVDWFVTYQLGIDPDPGHFYSLCIVSAPIELWGSFLLYLLRDKKEEQREQDKEELKELNKKVASKKRRTEVPAPQSPKASKWKSPKKSKEESK